MPMSEEAAQGLREAVLYNPAAAKFLMDCLRFLPMGVQYKEQDRYGPLTLMISTPQSIQITNDIHLPKKNPDPFPQERLKLCEIFNQEWLARRITKSELADRIEHILAASKFAISPETITPSSTLIIKRDETFILTDTHKLDINRRNDQEGK